jgi:hypothetical protein
MAITQDLLLHTAPLSVPAVVSLLEKAMAAEGIADKHKLLFAQRKVGGDFYNPNFRLQIQWIQSI